ncbi:MAG: hypothetical protein IPN33_25430 [Saprospiraceae bacterium]|nr:hypothetical protein [Saprospiraceae bacterium]
MTTGIIVGDYARFYINDEPVGYATSCTLDFSRETRQTLHKDNYTGSTGWATQTMGTASGTFSGEAFFSMDGYNSGTHASPFDIYAFLAAGTQTTVQFRIPGTLDAVGDQYWEFNAYITAQSISAPTNDNATFSFSGVVEGAPSVITIT